MTTMTTLTDTEEFNRIIDWTLSLVNKNNQILFISDCVFVGMILALAIWVAVLQFKIAKLSKESKK